MAKIWRRTVLPDLFRVSWPPRKPPQAADGCPATFGYDTETRDGYARLLCRSDGQAVWPKSSEECLLFLTQSPEDAYGFFWNLRYDATAMFKWLPEETLLQLSNGEEVTLCGYKVRFTPRFLRLLRGNRCWVYTDLFLTYRMGLNKAAEQYLGDRKLNYAVADIPERAFVGRDPELQRYCVQDAVLCSRLGERVIKAAINEGLPIPKRVYSPASFAEAVLVNDGLVEDRKRVPPYVQRAAYFAYAGNYTMSVKRGFFPEAEVWDINSSYPFALARVPSSPKRWRAVGRSYRWKPGDLAVVQASVHVTGLPSVKVIGTGGGVVFGFYPTGRFTAFFLGEELPSEYRVQRGWVAAHPGDTPYAGLVSRLYASRMSASDAAVADLYKLILNSLYGKLVQINASPSGMSAGYCFNPLTGAQVTCLARQRLHHAASVVGDRLIFVAADALAVDGGAGLQAGSGLGEWKLEHRGGLLVIRSGLYEFQTPNGAIKSRTRGFGGIGGSWVETLARSRSSKLRISDSHAVTIKEGLLLNEYAQADINRFVERVRTVDLNGDCSRLWPMVKSGRDLVRKQFNSEPLKLPHALMAVRPWHPVPDKWWFHAGGD